MQTLLSAIRNRTARVGIIGQGYVGLPLGLVFCEAGFPVTGFDVDETKVAALRRGESYIRHIGPERVAAAVASKRFTATSAVDRLAECDAILICVPTPLGKHREPDNSYIHRTAEEISRRLRPGQLVVLESTTYPGTTDEEVRPILEKSGRRCPEDFFLAFSPEREDPGNAQFSTRTIPKVVGGVNPASGEVAQALYSAALEKVVPVSSARVAESCKLLENIFRCVNIALVNELKMLCDRMNVDVWEVIQAAATKPFGFMPFFPGPGLGGHCIPIDPFYLTWKAREFEFQTKFIELAGEVNTSMPYYVVQRTMEGLNRQKKAINGAKLLVLGVAYKKDIDDLRESPSLRIITLLKERGAEVDFHDPFIPKVEKAHGFNWEMHSVPLEPERLGEYDAVLVLTDHSGIDYAEVVRQAKLVIDTRNVTKKLGHKSEKVIKA